MTDPKRWLEDDASAPAGAAELLRRARPSRPISASEMRRSRARLARYLSGAAVLGAWFWVKGIALGAGLGIVTVSAIELGPRFVRSLEPPASAPSAASPRAGHGAARPVAPAEVHVPESASAAPADPPASAIRRDDRPVGLAASAPSETVSAPRPDDPLAREAHMLEQARSLIGRDPSAALARLDEHAAAFPRGQLGIERELLRVEALRRAGRRGEARVLAERLHLQLRGSLYEERVRGMLDAMR
jgi:hypothetical protein